MLPAPNLHAEKVFVAFSGGCDSTALLLWAKQHFADVEAIHFNHGWPASKRIQDHALKVVADLGIKCQLGTATAPCLSETTARDARFGFFSSLPAESILLLGHNLEEQVETVIYQLSRGSKNPAIKAYTSRVGQHGIIHLRRPFLNTSKETLKRICRDANVEWFEDPSNEDTQHVRNKIRHKILPLLQELNEKSLEHWGEFFNDHQEEQASTVEDFSDLIRREELPCKVLDEYSTNTVGAILHKWLNFNGVEVNRSHIKACIEVARGIRKGWPLPGGKTLRRSKQILSIH